MLYGLAAAPDEGTGRDNARPARHCPRMDGYRIELTLTPCLVREIF